MYLYLYRFDFIRSRWISFILFLISSSVFFSFVELLDDFNALFFRWPQNNREIAKTEKESTKKRFVKILRLSNFDRVPTSWMKRSATSKRHKSNRDGMKTDARARTMSDQFIKKKHSIFILNHLQIFAWLIEPNGHIRQDNSMNMMNALNAFARHFSGIIFILFLSYQWTFPIQSETKSQHSKQ